nr:MAG: hypothetical protein 3 [Virgaviridae sp.]
MIPLKIFKMSQPQTPSVNIRTARVVRRRPAQVRAALSVQQRPTRRRNNSDDFSLVFQDITRTVTAAINRPVVLIVLLCVTALIYTHADDFSSGVIGKWLSHQQPQSGHLVRWLFENQMKFLGLLAFLPTIIDSPQNVQGILAIGSVLWIMLIPESSVYEYVIQSFCIHTYFRVRLQRSRLVIVAFVIIAYFAGFWTVMKHHHTARHTNPPLYVRPETHSVPENHQSRHSAG